MPVAIKEPDVKKIQAKRKRKKKRIFLLISYFALLFFIVGLVIFQAVHMRMGAVNAKPPAQSTNNPALYEVKPPETQVNNENLKEPGVQEIDSIIDNPDIKNNPSDNKNTEVKEVSTNSKPTPQASNNTKSQNTEEKASAASIKNKDNPNWNLILVNAKNPLPDDFVTPELVEIENGYDFDARAAKYLKQMLKDARKEGLSLTLCSAYRSYKKQTTLFNNKVQKYMNQGLSKVEAEKKAKLSVAYPGTSEHHTGLAADIMASYYPTLDEKQAETPEAKWLMANCHKYGFILRYPNDKTHITGIIFEPWHYRYVGIGAATEIMEKGLTLEEYLELKN